MTTEQTIRGLHKALYVACGFPALNAGPNDLRRWHDFLFALAPLNDEEAGGPLTPEDIQDVIGEMKRQNKAAQAKWSLRPQKILGDPEMFLDMVLIARKARRARPRPAASAFVEQRMGSHRRMVEVPVSREPTPAADELLAILHQARADS